MMYRQYCCTGALCRKRAFLRQWRPKFKSQSIVFIIGFGLVGLGLAMNPTVAAPVSSEIEILGNGCMRCTAFNSILLLTRDSAGFLQSCG
jgi:hypothetical protein